MNADIAPGKASMSAKLLAWVGRWSLLITLVFSIAAFSVVAPQMLEPGNLATILRSASIMGFMVLGLTWINAAGKLDVSFMQVAALANMVAAALVDAGYGWTLAILCGLACGALVGAINGWLIGVLRLSPLITTISTGGICGSIAAAVGKGTSIRIADAGLLGDLLMLTVGPVPVIALLVAALYGIAWWCQEHLTMGRYLYALAQNEEAVLEAGVPTDRLVLMLYTFTGLFCAGAGVLLAASLSSGQPMIGSSYFIDGLTAVLVGAMMIRIGQPNVIGTATGVVLLATLVSGGALLGWPDYQRDILKGVLLVGGVAFTVWIGRRTQAHRS